MKRRVRVAVLLSLTALVSQIVWARDVTVTVKRTDHNTSTITLQTTIESDIETVWGILTDYNHHAGFLPYMKKSHVLGQDEESQLVEQEGTIVILFWSFTMHVKQKVWEDEPRHMHFMAVEGDFEELQGDFWLTVPTVLKRQTHLVCDFTVKPKQRVPDWAVRLAAKQYLKKMVKVIADKSEAGEEVSAEQWVWVPFEVDKKYDGYRIDRFLSQRLVGYSRSKVQAILEEARVLKQGRAAKANSKVRTGEKIEIAYLRRPEKELAADASIPILFEDEDLIVLNKPADLLSHPTDKIVNNTVLGLLRHARPDLSKLHLLHRLDRETSGVIALAKNPKAARAWTRHMEAHRIQKEYVAVVRGKVTPKEGVIDKPIGKQGGAIRVRQWINTPDAVPARTRYLVLAIRPGLTEQRSGSLDQVQSQRTVVRVFPETGRLHQIRVHFAAMGNPLLGDPLYTGEGELYKKMTEGTCTEADRLTLGFWRVALHAASLRFLHPITGAAMHIEAPLPEDMKNLISDKLITQ